MTGDGVPHALTIHQLAIVTTSSVVISCLESIIKQVDQAIVCHIAPFVVCTMQATLVLQKHLQGSEGLT